MHEHARRLLAAGIFTAEQEDDALHVAAASITRHDVLLSWNFKHLVNRQRRAGVHALALQVGIPTIDIISPPEI